MKSFRWNHQNSNIPFQPKVMIKKNCWKLPKLLRCRKAHSFQTPKISILNFDRTNWRLVWMLLMTSLSSSISYNFMSRLLTIIAMILYTLRTCRSITIVRIFHIYKFLYIYSLNINIKYYLFKYVTSNISIVNVLQFVGFSFYIATSMNILIRNVDFRKGRNTVLSTRHHQKRLKSWE